MRWVTRLVAGGGIAAFFFFSWVIMMLWNSIVAGHLGLARALSYLQACGLWFLIILLFAWTGVGVRWSFRRGRFTGHQGEEGLEQKVKQAFARWVGAEKDLDWDELGELIEKKIKSRIKEWLAEGED